MTKRLKVHTVDVLKGSLELRPNARMQQALNGFAVSSVTGFAGASVTGFAGASVTGFANA